MRRYGFHGLSCESILRQLGRGKRARIVVAHLGSGASVTAVKGGRSVDTSMGLTPTGGVIMGTRSGDLDPGVLVYLAREKRFDPGRLEDLLNRRSGLRGISELDSDMRRLHEAARRSPRARLAVEMFCYSVRREIAAMIASLGGLDTLVFTGGIGEHDAKARRAICAGLAWAGVELDAGRNRAGADPIGAAGSRCRVRVLRAEEEKQIARHAWALTRTLRAS
jgi:acetate kinase